jgi:hypothetical protein
MKITLHTKQNRVFHGGAVEIEQDRIRCNNVIFSGEFNPHNVRLWIIGNEFGALGGVWASSEQDALNELVDCGLGDSLLISEEDQASATDDEREEWARLGNAGEPADLELAWMAEVEFVPARDWPLMLALAEARGACADSLDDIRIVNVPA